MEVFKADVLILGGGLSAYMSAYTLLKKRKKDSLDAKRRGYFLAIGKWLWYNTLDKE